ncbi:protein FAM83F-like [Brachyhypopomus gauderio]|uniref:protein FAM83F-like n=1 Tax=Brachyhypopomus gauderio TaxID=698409 RepID=UPI0040410067
MAESQLMCMEDGHINEKIPESRPEFYYSEEQRAAVEELLKNGDGAFKTRLKEDNFMDFLSAREIKVITGTHVMYKTDESDEEQKKRFQKRRDDDDSSLRSTYWPEMSDTEVPPLDMGWPSGGFFKGVTRVAIHTHPPKDNGPHIKEVVRKLIQGAVKVIAIVMDLLTDLQILQDLLDAASKRNVPVYIVLDIQGVPHFLDMCSRLRVSSRHLGNIRARTVRGVGFDMSFGRVPGSLCNKYMLIDGDKVAFGSYSYSWTTSRMDRNMITVLSGQIVDTFDRDFRELYAISDKLNLFKEFNISRTHTDTLTRVTVPKRPTLSNTSRFQVSLGDRGDLKVPAHKYYNPKYLLALGEIDRNATSMDLIDKMAPEAFPEDRTQMQDGSGNPENLSPDISKLPDQTLSKSSKKTRLFDMKPLTLKKNKQKKTEGSKKKVLEDEPAPSTAGTPAMTNHITESSQGPERAATPGGSEKLDQLNIPPDITQNKSNKRTPFFKKKSATPKKSNLKNMESGNKEALKVMEQGSPAPSPPLFGNPRPSNVAAKQTQHIEDLHEKEPTPAKAKTKNPNENKSPGQQTTSSQEDQGSEAQEHARKTCVVS